MKISSVKSPMSLFGHPSLDINIYKVAAWANAGHEEDVLKPSVEGARTTSYHYK